MNKALTLTIVANMTANYGESLGNITSIQKIYRDGKVFSVRTKESLKNRIMTQSCFYDDLKTVVSGATQLVANAELNVSNCRALEGGYMTTGISAKGKKVEGETKSRTYKRNSSFYVTDAVSCEEFNATSRFHNNLSLATNFADNNGLNVQSDAGDCGLMIYQYEFHKCKRVYSITIDLEMIGVDKNFNVTASNTEKADRVITLLNTIKNLYLVVKQHNDNAQPLFVVGGLTEYKTHVFENLVKVKDNKLLLNQSLKDEIANFKSGIQQSNDFDNENDIISELQPLSITQFFKSICDKINKHFGV